MFYAVIINMVLWVVSIPPAWISLVTVGCKNSIHVVRSLPEPNPELEKSEQSFSGELEK